MTGFDNAPTSRPGETATTPPQPTITELVSGILNDAQKLARQQIEMFKAEVKEDMARTKRATLYGGLGIVGLTVGAISLVFGLVWLLHEQFQFSLWGSWFIIGTIFLAVGVSLGLVALNLVESFNPLPDKTFNALQENITWKTAPQT